MDNVGHAITDSWQNRSVSLPVLSALVQYAFIMIAILAMFGNFTMNSFVCEYGYIIYIYISVS